MSLEIHRLHLATMTSPADGSEVPVHGFVVRHPGGAVLVDTGVGGPERVLSDWRAVNTTTADALAALDLTPSDIGLVINTHLHFDHCGQNAVFTHAPLLRAAHRTGPGPPGVTRPGRLVRLQQRPVRAARRRR
jgi:N-acyl homoserine lactone hydrolase